MSTDSWQQPPAQTPSNPNPILYQLNFNLRGDTLRIGINYQHPAGCTCEPHRRLYQKIARKDVIDQSSIGWNPASNSEGGEGFVVREVQGRRAPLGFNTLTQMGGGRIMNWMVTGHLSSDRSCPDRAALPDPGSPLSEPKSEPAQLTTTPCPDSVFRQPAKFVRTTVGTVRSAYSYNKSMNTVK